MFAINRSALAVLAPLALLLAAVTWSNLSAPPATSQQLAEGAVPESDQSVADSGNQTVAANLPSR